MATAIIGGLLGEGGSKLINSVNALIRGKSPEDAAALAQLQTKYAAEFQLAEIQAKIAEDANAAANIQAEAKSADKYTSRARPSFLYVMLGIFIFNWVVFPIFNRPSIQYPDAMFWLFGSCMLGYTGARTWEKITQGKQ